MKNRLRPLTLVLLLWLLVYYQGVVTAIQVWQVSEIFTHCFLVLPCSFYFIYQKRALWLSHQWTPNYWLLPVLLGTLFVQLFGQVGDIRLFMHIASFSALPLIIWMVIGNQAAKEIRFPLFLMLFSIPVGEQLIPYLQIITTDLAVPLIELSNVPVYRNGFYLEIPEGKFLVAEACSGISFLIASVVFGCLYAYVSFTSLLKQLLFVLVAVAVPIIANAVRVFGIVLTAHLTDMEYAAGADHIVYGGVFYGIIIFILIFIGERFRDKDFTKPTEQSAIEGGLNQRSSWPVCLVISISLFAQLLWKYNIEARDGVTAQVDTEINLAALAINPQTVEKTDWQPNYAGASEVKRGLFAYDARNIDYYIALYTDPKAELISATNKLFDKEQWSLLSQRGVQISEMNANVQVTKLVSVYGKYRYIVHWYQYSDQIYVSQIKLKLEQTANSLFGQEQHGAVIAFSITEADQSDEAINMLLQFITTNASKISNIISQSHHE